MRFVVGTAGHIDHGKTALVRALTGVDTDRLKEEKARGITIELGFAPLVLPTPDRQTVSVVDVPGHERFVRTMVAGATGIDLVLFVVAADEGVMPQTREHLRICTLLGVRRGLVALTKIDLVNDELRALAEAELADTLRGTFLEDAPVLPCSTVTGEGLAAIPAAIAALLADAPTRDDAALFRLPIDRVFSLKGFGTVVTGTTASGAVRRDDEVIALPAREPKGVRVRSIEVHGAAVERASAGQRSALNLPLPKDQLERGQVLVHPGTLEAGDRLDVALSWLPGDARPLPRRARLLFHHGTMQCQAMVNLLDCGEVAPGGVALAQLLLDRPIVALPGDRFVLRGFRRAADHSTTVGGGEILRTLGARHRRATPALAQLLAATRDAPLDERVRLEVERAGRAGIAAPALQMRLPSAPKATAGALQRLLTARAVVRHIKEPAHYLGATALTALGDELVTALRRWHDERPLEPAMPKESLRATIAEPRLLAAALEPLLGRGAVIAVGDGLRLREHDAERASHARGVDALAERVATTLLAAGLQPPRAVDLASALGVPATALTAALVRLVREQRIVKVGELHFHVTPLGALREALLARFATTPEITPTAWKELVGASRKFAIPLAEYFDAIKLTLRVGDNRRLRRV